MTVADANAGVAQWMREEAAKAQTPPATSPPAPVATTPQTTVPVVAGPLTSFGALSNAPIGNGPSLIPPGLYSTVANGQLCDIEQDDAAGDWIGRRFATDGPLIFRIRSDASRLTTTGPCTWNLGVPSSLAAAPNGDGVLRVGIDIAPGRYLAPNSPTTECYWETATDSDGSLDAITDNSFSKGPQLAIIDPDETVFATSGCGTWSPLPTLPGSYLHVITSPLAVGLQGHRAFYSGANLAVSVASNGWDSIVASGQGWSFTFDGPQGSALAAGTWPTDGPWDATGHRSTLTGPGVSCFGEPGSVSVANVVRDGSSAIVGFDLLWISECGGTFPNIVNIHHSTVTP